MNGPPPHPLVADALRQLDHGVRLINRLDDAGWADAGHCGTPIGAHYRHVLDHFAVLIRSSERGVVDYEARDRDPRIERERTHAQEVTTVVLRAVRELDPERSLQIRLRGGAAAELDLGTIPTTMARELVFVMLHAVHHYALVALELRMRGVPVDPSFGVAPATLGYWRVTG